MPSAPVRSGDPTARLPLYPDLEPPAIAGLIRLRQADPATAQDVRAAVLALARDPEPVTSSPLGTAGLCRIRLFLDAAAEAGRAGLVR